MRIPDKVVEWLLGGDNPPVRYLTLVNLLGKSPRSREVREARSRGMDYSVTREILRRAREFASEDDDRAYWKYTGKYWQVIFLGQFLADGKDHRIAGIVNGLLEKRGWISKSGGQCLTANILAALMRLGFGDHPVVREESEALAARILADGGIRCHAMDYSLLSRCHMAQPKLLHCFAQIPVGERSKAVRAAIDLLVANLVANEVFVYVPGRQKEWQEALEKAPKAADLPEGKTAKAWVREKREAFLAKGGLGARRPKPGWLRFGFPLHYNSDVLEAMVALALLGIPMQSGLEKPLRAIEEKRTPEGTWILENTLNGKMLADVEEKGKPSKWLTYFGHFVLDRFATA